MVNTIDAFLTEYIRRTNTHRFDEVAPLVDEDAVFWFSSGSYRGLAAIRAAFEQTWSIIQDENYGVEDLEWLTIDGLAATCIYTFRWQGNIEGVIREGVGRGTTILRRDGERWRIIHEHLCPRP